MIVSNYPAAKLQPLLKTTYPAVVVPPVTDAMVFVFKVLPLGNNTTFDNSDNCVTVFN